MCILAEDSAARHRTNFILLICRPYQQHLDNNHNNNNVLVLYVNKSTRHIKHGGIKWAATSKEINSGQRRDNVSASLLSLRDEKESLK